MTIKIDVLANLTRRQIMTLGEELSRKYALTSFKAKGASLVMLAINEALEAAAEIADQEHSPLAASRIRSLKWADNAIAPVPIDEVAPFTKAA